MESAGTPEVCRRPEEPPWGELPPGLPSPLQRVLRRCAEIGRTLTPFYHLAYADGGAAPGSPATRGSGSGSVALAFRVLAHSRSASFTSRHHLKWWR